MCPRVVKELVNSFLGVHSRGLLLRGNVGQCHQYGGVDDTGIIEETSNDLLYALLTSGIQEGTVVSRCRGLNCLYHTRWEWESRDNVVV